MPETPTISIAYFVSPHGYGHATRASAVIEALTRLQPIFHFDIFTTVPEWVFRSSLSGSYRYHALLSDIGFMQKNALEIDLPGTLNRLDDFYPLPEVTLANLAEQLATLQTHLAICDIAPLGIAAAHGAGIPAILIENFTWDWLYEPYRDRNSRIEKHIAYLQHLFNQADYRIQTTPLCDPQPADLTVPPICRPIREPAAQVRQRLGIPATAPTVMLTMGGLSWNYADLDPLANHPDYYFLIPGVGEQLHNHGHLVTLPHHSDFHHPDLINAADAIIGKVGYSTVAEIYQAGAPFGYVARTGFRESPALIAYIEQNLSGLPIQESDFADGRWLGRLPDLLALPRLNGQHPNGADQVARFIYDLLESEGADR